MTMPVPWQDRFLRFVAFDGSSCWPWVGARNPEGYGVFHAAHRPYDGDAPQACRLPGGRALAHRFMYAALRGEPTGECLMHSCDRRECVNPWHLTDASRVENNADMVAKGRLAKNLPSVMRERAPRGTSHYTAKLNEDSVRIIRRWRAEGVSHGEAARRLGVSAATVSQVIRGRTWKHVT